MIYFVLMLCFNPISLLQSIFLDSYILPVSILGGTNYIYRETPLSFCLRHLVRLLSMWLLRSIFTAWNCLDIYSVNLTAFDWFWLQDQLKSEQVISFSIDSSIFKIPKYLYFASSICPIIAPDGIVSPSIGFILRLMKSSTQQFFRLKSIRISALKLYSVSTR